jgi:signal transduction histidine kinase
MSHELRTPLNSVIGFSDLLETELSDQGLDDLSAYAQRIRRSSEGLLAMINELLDFAKIEAGRMDLVVEDFSIAELVNDAAETARPLVERNRNRLEIACDGLGSLLSDKTKLRQCLLNLLSNAAKFTQEGVIRLEARRIPDYVIFSVSGTGRGMAPEQAAKLFEPFSQVHRATPKAASASPSRAASAN